MFYEFYEFYDFYVHREQDKSISSTPSSSLCLSRSLPFITSLFFLPRKMDRCPMCPMCVLSFFRCDALWMSVFLTQQTIDRKKKKAMALLRSHFIPQIEVRRMWVTSYISASMSFWTLTPLHMFLSEAQVAARYEQRIFTDCDRDSVHACIHIFSHQISHHSSRKKRFCMDSCFLVSGRSESLGSSPKLCAHPLLLPIGTRSWLEADCTDCAMCSTRYKRGTCKDV